MTIILVPTENEELSQESKSAWSHDQMRVVKHGEWEEKLKEFELYSD